MTGYFPFTFLFSGAIWWGWGGEVRECCSGGCEFGEKGG